MHVKKYLSQPALKRAYTLRLFTVVAPRYWAATRGLSLCRDRAWKKHLLRLLPSVENGDAVLDLACGTGDITVSLAWKYPAAHIVGSDLSRSMARIAFRKTRGQDVALTIQDMAAMAIKDNSFSIVTGGYALRNAPEVDAVIRETARILKPGGKAAFLDFSKSPRPMVAAFQCAALVLWGSLWGAILHARPSVYAYLGHSLAAYPDRRRLHALFEESGLSVAASLMKMLGMIEIVIVQKK